MEIAFIQLNCAHTLPAWCQNLIHAYGGGVNALTGCSAWCTGSAEVPHWVLLYGLQWSPELSPYNIFSPSRVIVSHPFLNLFGHTIEPVNKTAFFNGFIGIRISNCSHFSLYITGSFCGIWLANVDIVLCFPAFVGNNGLKSILWVFILPKSMLVSHMPINHIFLSIIRAPADD